jgi:hypothetical protein
MDLININKSLLSDHSALNAIRHGGGRVVELNDQQ